MPKQLQFIHNQDFRASVLLLALWLLFFWRLFTPIAADQASLKQGDFSGQFVAFGAYQYDRLSAGEVPLWNPYNNGGLPFIGDTQAAVFYPPRLITIALTNISGTGWTYNALQMEMVFHVLLYSLMMYAFVRRLTLGNAGSVLGSLVAAIIAAYGGYVSGYPPLQLALLEAGIWLPLATIGILEATRADRLQWKFLVLTGFALGLSWMAGHPQTSWFLTYLLLAYFAYRVYSKRLGWQPFVMGTALFGCITIGMTAVQLFPGFEYLFEASRVDLGFDAKSNGFPFRDVMQIVYPGSVSLFSPLYLGIPALVFIGIAIWRKCPQWLFWLGVLVVGLLHSFGGNSTFFDLVYNFVPGLRFFRGQERAAFLFANSAAILAGMGAGYLADWNESSILTQRLKRILLGFAIITWILAFNIFIVWQLTEQVNGDFASTAILTALIATTIVAILWWYLQRPQTGLLLWLLIAVIVFELFSVNMNATSNYDGIPASNQLTWHSLNLLQPVQEDLQGQPSRADGFRGLTDNYGSLHQIYDMRGISPLFLRGPAEIIHWNYVFNPAAWELFAVKHVYSEQESLGLDSEIIAEGSDFEGQVFLHELSNPRPFAHLVTDVEVVDSDASAYERILASDFDLRNTILLDEQPVLNLPDSSPENATVTITDFEPERIRVEVSTDTTAILSLAHPDYPGWEFMLNGEPVDSIRAYGALTALPIPAGEQEVMLIYNPASYRFGAIISMFTWIALFGFGIWVGLRRRGMI